MEKPKNILSKFMRYKTFLLWVFLFTFSLGGCYNIRKKFIRKKKYHKEEPVYVDFKDYPQKPSKEAYLDNYLFVRGWLDELMQSLADGVSFKRRRRAVNRAVENIEDMFSFLNEEGRNKLYVIYEQFVSLKEEINRNPNLSQLQRNRLIKKIEKLKLKFEKSFNFLAVEKWMK